MGIQISLQMMAFLVFMTGFAGFIDSAAGGGGLISLPAYLFAGLPPHYTYATNKFSAACGTTFATASFFKNGAMNLKVGILAAIGSFAGSALGAHIVLMLSDEVLQMMMFIILPIAAVIILWRRNLPDENRDDGTLNLKKILLALGIGLGIGLYDGIVGPGTGTFAIIAFTTLMGFDLRTANGNGKVLNLASNYASLFTYLMNGLVVFHIGIPCAVSNILGNLLGSHFALKKGARFIRPMMLVVLVLLRGGMSRASVAAKQKTGAINAEIESGLSGIRTVKAFGNETIQQQRFDCANETFKTAKRGFHREMGRFNATMELFVTLLNVAVIAGGGWLMMGGRMDYVDLITFSLYITTYITPVRKLTNFAELFSNGFAGLHRFIELMGTEPAITDAPDAAAMPAVRGAIDVNDVSFTYDCAD